MPTFSINDGNSATLVDTTPNGGFTIDFDRLDNSFSLQINGVELFVGGPAGDPHELQFQVSGTSGQTVRFANGDEYEADTPAIWQLDNTGSAPVLRLVVNPDGTIALSGVRANNAALEPLELFNGLTVNSAAIAAAWNDSGPNTITIDQSVTGPTNANGEFSEAPCFASGTLIDTIDGPTPIEALHVGDRVRTLDGRFEPIRWIGSRRLSAAQLRANPKVLPIVIRAHALAPGFPVRDLRVSPQHRILISSRIARRMFGCDDVLIPAQKLLPLPGIDRHDRPDEGVTYWHLLFDTHQIIWSNGAPTESLLTGPQALKALSPDAREEIETLFPEVCAPGFRPDSARHIPARGKRIKKLVARHQMNGVPLYCGA